MVGESEEFMPQPERDIVKEAIDAAQGQVEAFEDAADRANQLALEEHEELAKEEEAAASAAADALRARVQEAGDDDDVVAAWQQQHGGGAMQKLARSRPAQAAFGIAGLLAVDAGMAGGDTDKMVSMNAVEAVAEAVNPNVDQQIMDIESAYRIDVGAERITPLLSDPIMVDGVEHKLENGEVATVQAMELSLDLYSRDMLYGRMKEAQGPGKVDLRRILDSCSYTFVDDAGSEHTATDLTMARMVYGHSGIAQAFESVPAMEAGMDSVTNLSKEQRRDLAPIIASAMLEEQTGFALAEDFHREAELTEIGLGVEGAHEVYRAIFDDALERSAQLLELAESSGHPEAMRYAPDVIQAQVNMQIDQAMISHYARGAVDRTFISIDPIEQLTSETLRYDTGVQGVITAAEYTGDGANREVTGSQLVGGSYSFNASITPIDAMSIHAFEMDRALEDFANAIGDAEGADELRAYDGANEAKIWMQELTGTVHEGLERKHAGADEITQWTGLSDSMMSSNGEIYERTLLLKEHAMKVADLAKAEVAAHDVLQDAKEALSIAQNDFEAYLEGLSPDEAEDAASNVTELNERVDDALSAWKEARNKRSSVQKTNLGTGDGYQY